MSVDGGGWVGGGLIQIVAVALVKFIAHLVNQQVAHEILALEVRSVAPASTLAGCPVMLG